MKYYINISICSSICWSNCPAMHVQTYLFLIWVYISFTVCVRVWLFMLLKIHKHLWWEKMLPWIVENFVEKYVHTNTCIQVKFYLLIHRYKRVVYIFRAHTTNKGEEAKQKKQKMRERNTSRRQNETNIY